VADVTAALRNRLAGHAGTSAIVGTRLWFLFLPQNPTLPAVTIQQISGLRESAMGADVGKVQGRVQVDSWGDSRGGAKNLAEQVRAALQRLRGTFDGTTINAAFLDSETEEFESGSHAWRVRQDYRIWWSES
jgi:hypothetical protein